MAKPDDSSRALRNALRREEEALAAFFDAARAEPPEPPSDALLARVLADADALAPARPQRARRRAWPDLGALLRPLGGWGAAAALAGCLAAGFLAGSLGAGAGLATETIWADHLSVEAAAQGVDGFFDLTAAEG